MATDSQLESSLRRSASLGLEVLVRASRRNVDWSNIRASHTSTFTDVHTSYKAAKTHTELNEAFAAMTDFMAQTTHHCMRFYQSEGWTDKMEKNHVQRFHSCAAPGASRSASTAKMRVRGEDFVIGVVAGTYSVTASLDESLQQTQVVTLTPGESVHLTFNL